MGSYEGTGNVLPLKELLSDSSPPFSLAVLDALVDAGFDISTALEFSSLQMANEVSDAIGSVLADAFPGEWPNFETMLGEVARAGVLLDLKERHSRLQFMPV